MILKQNTHLYLLTLYEVWTDTKTMFEVVFIFITYLHKDTT